jgi:hypothetical protein
LNDVGDVGVGERQVLDGPGETPELSQLSNRRLKSSGDLVMCVYRRRGWLAVH